MFASVIVNVLDKLEQSIGREVTAWLVGFVLVVPIYLAVVWAAKKGRQAFKSWRQSSPLAASLEYIFRAAPVCWVRLEKDHMIHVNIGNWSQKDGSCAAVAVSFHVKRRGKWIGDVITIRGEEVNDLLSKREQRRISKAAWRLLWQKQQYDYQTRYVRLSEKSLNMVKELITKTEDNKAQEQGTAGEGEKEEVVPGLRCS